jgi:Hint domain
MLEHFDHRRITLMSSSKATLMRSRRSFLAASKLIVGAGVSLALARRSALAQQNGTNQNGTNQNGNKQNVSCVLRATRIKTTKGDVCIEELQIGDTVATVSGEAKQIKFIGRKDVCRERSQPWIGQGPVKIARFAIDGKVPQSDLYVSPCHAIYIDGVLIPAKYLVNGISIVDDAKPEALSLTYFHIELDTHEVILAEGLAVESFLRDDPHAFDNANEYVSLYGPPGEPLTPFAPRVAYNRRHELASHLRSAFAPVYDFRKPADKVRDRIADRAAFACAA